MTTSTIFALSSGAGRAGVAVIRVSGARAAHVAENLSGDVPRPREATLAKLRDARGELLDEAVLLWFPKPKSFTGEDVLEIHTHGSPAVIRAVLAALGEIENCRAAEPGEFTRRAFLNGKMDLTEIEGLSDLLSSDTDRQRRAALRETIGESRALYTRWRAELVEAIALIEALIDFSADEGIPDSALDTAAHLLGGLKDEMKTHLEKARSSEVLRDGLTVVLAGPPNAGKSSLLNALARRDVAIVTDEPGTTRDMIEVKLDLNGLPVTLVDTAGLREAQNKIEEEGIRRAKARAASADLVLWLQPVDEASRTPPSHPTPTWIVCSKADLVQGRHCEEAHSADDLAPPKLPQSYHQTPQEGYAKARAIQLDQFKKAGSPRSPSDPQRQRLRGVSGPGSLAMTAKRALSVSAKTGAGIAALLEKLSAYAQQIFGDESEDAVFLRERHRQLLQESAERLQTMLENIKAAPLEILAEDLRAASQPLERIMGFIGAEEMLGAIFERFCVGK